MRLAEPIYYKGKKLIEAGIPLNSRKIAILRKLLDPSFFCLVLEKGEELSEFETSKEPKYRTGNGATDASGAVDSSSDSISSAGSLKIRSWRKSFLVPDLYSEPSVDEYLLSVRSKVLEATRLSLEEPHIACLCNSRGVKAYIFSVIGELTKVKDVLINIGQILGLDTQIFKHSVNVCALSLIYSRYFNESREKAKVLAAGTLLHDVGKTRCSEVSLQEPLFSDKAEQNHPVWSFAILKNFENLGVVPAYIALQHHEWYNGKGFPGGLQGDRILRPAKILAILHYYDRLAALSERVNNKKDVIIEAINKIIQDRGTRFDPKLVSDFLVLTGYLEKNSFVQISSGEIGLIIQKNTDPLKPIIKLMFERSGHLYRSFPEINLALEKDLKVIRILNLNAVWKKGSL